MRQLFHKLTFSASVGWLALMFGFVLGAFAQRQYDKAVFLEHMKVLQRLTWQAGDKCDHVVLDCTAAYVEHCGKLD